MSMTMIAFYSKEKKLTKLELESRIVSLGYDFKFLEEFDNLESIDGACELNGIKTFFETDSQEKKEILNDYPFLDKNLSELDSGISFVWGADFMAGACIDIISLALMEHYDAKIVYVDDEIWYTNEMLVSEIQDFIQESKKQPSQKSKTKKAPKTIKKRNLKWLNLTLFALAVISVILMSRGIISWYIPAVLLALIVGSSIIKERGNQFNNKNEHSTKKSKLPKRILIKRMEEYHTHYLGKYGEGKFFGYVTFAHKRPHWEVPKELQRQNRLDFAVVYTFDKKGRFISEKHWIASSDLDQHKLYEKLEELIHPLGQIEFCDITVDLFETEIEGIKFGLIANKEFGVIDLQPSSTIEFQEPWDGEYDT